MSAIRIFSKFKELLDVSWGSIADGQVLKRNGANIIGTAMPQGPPGPAGAPGVAQVWKGEWSTSVVYSPNDAVSYNGSSFVATQSTIGVAPVPVVPPALPPLATTASRGTIAALPSANQTQYYARGDNTWQILPQGTYVVGPASSVAGNVATYADTTGKLLGSVAPASFIPVGNVVQTKFIELAYFTFANVLIPVDDTVPQITEGMEVANLILTPLYVNSLVRVRMSGNAAASTNGNWFTVAIFRGIGPSAICFQQAYANIGGGQMVFSMIKYDAPATTSAITYTVRVGLYQNATAWVGRYASHALNVIFEEIRQ